MTRHRFAPIDGLSESEIEYLLTGRSPTHPLAILDVPDSDWREKWRRHRAALIAAWHASGHVNLPWASSEFDADTTQDRR